jgi:type II/III secretion system protein
VSFRLRAAAGIVLGVCAAAPNAAFAQAAIETITLHHRSAEQLIPLLQPLVEPGGALSGRDNALYLRASAGNRKQIRALVASLDRAPHRLAIWISDEPPRVSSSLAATAAPNDKPGTVILDSRAANAGAEPADKPGTFIAGSSTGATRITDPTRPAPASESVWSTAAEGGGMPLHLLEDEPFDIETERAVPIQFWTRAAGQDKAAGGSAGNTAAGSTAAGKTAAGTGTPGIAGTMMILQPAVLEARARLAAGSSSGWVVVELTPQGESLAAPVSTTVRGRIGRWFAVSAASHAGGNPNRQRGLWLKVDDAGIVDDPSSASPR